MKDISYIGAGAGSGKTYDLTERIVALVLEGCKMSEFILTTFTRKAAAEFSRKTREKLLERAAGEASLERKRLLLTAATELDSAIIGTVHSVCMQYLKKYWYKIGMSAQVTEMDEDAKAEHLKKTVPSAADEEDIAFFHRYAREMKLWSKESEWQAILGNIITGADSFDIDDLSQSECKSKELVELILSLDGCAIIEHEPGKDDDYYRNLVLEYVSRLFKIARKWQNEFKAYKEEHALIEFCDMETLFLRLLEDEEVRSEISSSVKYLFVDEFQDSNPKQVKIFDRLSDLVRKTVWVGDPKQSIFKFRGSDIALVRSVINNKDGAVTKEKPLEESWRSEKRLVDTANTVFKRVFTHALPENEIVLRPHRGEDLPDGARSLHHWDLTKGPQPDNPSKTGCTKDMLFSAIAAQVNEILAGRSDIRYVIDKDSGKARPIVPSDIAILTRTGQNNSGQDGYKIVEALKAWGVPVIHEDRIDPQSYELTAVSLILSYMVTSDSSLLNSELNRILNGRSIGEIFAATPEELKEGLGKVEELKKTFGGGSIAGIVRGAVVRLGLLERCAQWGFGESRRRNLICLINAAEAYDEECLKSGESATIEGFLSVLAEGVPVPEGYFGGGVTVCTYHKSKGLEWGVVILTGLENDSTSQNVTLSRYTSGIQAVRIGKPDSGNIYSNYYLRVIPPISSKKIKGEVTKVILASDEYTDYCVQEMEEAQRLLYVGFTRARDYLVSTSNVDNRRPHGLMRWFEAIGLPTDGVDGNWQDGSLQTIWGPGTEPCLFRKIPCMAPHMPMPLTYLRMAQKEPDGTEKSKRILPSCLADENPVTRTALSFLNGDGELVQKVKTVKPHEKETAIGTCIHNIFAAYRPDAPEDDMIQMAGRTISNFSLEKNLPQPETLIGSIASLYAFLANTYGRAVRIEREMPFRRKIGGQTCVGTIDFVWYTSEKDCVLVDFKNISGATRGVIDPDSDEYMGHYIPQQKAYKEALESAGLNVRACLLHLSLQERVIEISFNR